MLRLGSPGILQNAYIYLDVMFTTLNSEQSLPAFWEDDRQSRKKHCFLVLTGPLNTT